MRTSSSSEAVRMMEFALSKLTEWPFTAKIVSPVRGGGEGGGQGEGRERGRGWERGRREGGREEWSE